MALSALVVLAGLASRLTGGEELSAAVIATPTPTPLTATFDETVETRQVTCPAETWYCLQTGVFSTLEAAQEKSAAYSDRGAPGYVAQDGDKYRVLLSAYGTQEEAQRVRERLDTQQAVDTYVHEMTRPELPLQLTGMRGQLDVIEAAMALLPTLADQWRDAALMVDQGEMTLEEAQRMAAESLEQCRVMLQVLNERFVSPGARPGPAAGAALHGGNGGGHTAGGSGAHGSDHRLRAAENGSAGAAPRHENYLGGHAFPGWAIADERNDARMTLRKIAELLQAEVLTGEDKLDTEAVTACGSDLMSDVLAFVKDRTILITGLVNAHVVRTAEMLDIICVVFARGKRPGEEILEAAREIDLPVMATKMTTYTACGELYLHGLPGTKEKPQS